MRTTPLARPSAVLVLGLLVLLSALPAAAQASPPPPVSGTIRSVTANRLTLTLADSSTRDIQLESKTLILKREPAAIDDLKVGAALGVAARRDGADLIATTINIFTGQLWDVVRKGQWPMASGEVMTNALVTDTVQGVSGRTIKMRYEGIIASIRVPESARIYRFLPETRAALTVGLPITVRGTEGTGGVLIAGAISFDRPAGG